MIEAAIKLLLASDEQLRELVGDRIYFVMRPQDERRPCVILKRVSTFFARTFGGDSGWPKGRMQIDALAESYPTVKRIVQRVRDVIEGFADDVKQSDPRYAVTATIRERCRIRIQYLEVEDERDIEAAPLVGKATPTFGTSVDTRFLYEEMNT